MEISDKIRDIFQQNRSQNPEQNGFKTFVRLPKQDR